MILMTWSDIMRWSFLRLVRYPILRPVSLAFFGSYLNPVVIPKLMAERGTKRGIIRSVSLWPMSLAPTNGELVCDAGKNLSVGGKGNSTW